MARGAEGTPSSRRTKSPRFNTVEEAAQFWDTHDSAEFDDEFEDVSDVRFVVTRGRPKKAIAVRMDEDTVATFTERAREKGIGPSTLVRLWILERLRAEQRQSA